MRPGYQHEDMWQRTLKHGKRYVITEDSENGIMLVDTRTYPGGEPVANDAGEYELSLEEAERMFGELERE